MKTWLAFLAGVLVSGPAWSVRSVGGGQGNATVQMVLAGNGRWAILVRKERLLRARGPDDSVDDAARTVRSPSQSVG
jgi:hypothetical protein